MKHSWFLILVLPLALAGCGDSGNGGDEPSQPNTTDHEQNNRITSLENGQDKLFAGLGRGFQRLDENQNTGNANIAEQIKNLKTDLRVELRREEVVVAGGAAPQGGKELFKEAWRELREEEELDEFRQQKEAERTSDALLDALRRRDQEKAAAECIPLSQAPSRDELRKLAAEHARGRLEQGYGRNLKGHIVQHPPGNVGGYTYESVSTPYGDVDAYLLRHVVYLRPNLPVERKA